MTGRAVSFFATTFWPAVGVSGDWLGRVNALPVVLVSEQAVSSPVPAAAMPPSTKLRLEKVTSIWDSFAIWVFSGRW